MKLIAVTANNLVINGRTQGTPLRLLLTFEGERRLRLGGSGDDGAMVIDDLPLDPASDMGPSGRIVVADAAPLLGAPLVGAAVSGVHLVLLVGQRVGIRLSLVDQGAFLFWLDGDELWWGSEMEFAAHLWPADGQPQIGPMLAI